MDHKDVIFFYHGLFSFVAKRLPKKYTKTSICQIFRLAALAIIAFSHDDDEMPIMKLFVFKKEGAQKTRAVVHINEGQHRRI